MSSAIVAADQFGARLPAPGEMFVSVIVHPQNIAIEEKRGRARLMSAREVKQAQTAITRIDKLLNEVGYFEMLAEYNLLRQRYKYYISQRGQPETDAEENERMIAQVVLRGRVLTSELALYHGQAKQQAALIDQLHDHQLARQRERLRHNLQTEQAKEAHVFADLIQQRWAQMGFKYEFLHKNKWHVNKVEFEDIQVTADAIWLKIWVASKALFGFKSRLPQGVRVLDLIKQETLDELSFACQRQVSAKATKNNGVWIVINRVGTNDGIINYCSLEQLLASYPAQDRDKLPVPIGVGENRTISWILLSEHPHFLVAGSTGNGKSNLTHSIISTLIQKHSPDEVRFIFVDLKEGGAEFRLYENIPHLLMPVVDNVEDAVNVLGQVDALRSERMQQIAAAGCRNILEYNARNPANKLYRIIVMVDEYARIKARGKEFAAAADRHVSEITALGRASGVHLYAATQTPYSDILPGHAKANMALRLAFALPSVENSRAVLGNGEAYKELPQDVKGRAIVAVGSRHWQVQTPHCRDTDIDHALAVADGWAPPDEHIELPEVAQIREFNEQVLLDIVINDLNGNLGAYPVFNYVKDSESVTLSELREMVKLLIKQSVIEFEGETYDVRKHKKGHILVKATKQQHETP